ncbi:MAG: CPXCG motif-containing cysteine-rich protein [Pseudomonadales bacterium]
MLETLTRRISCPYCGEPVEVIVDASVDDQEYIEDCMVCCRPITLHVLVDGDEVTIAARDENDA